MLGWTFSSGFRREINKGSKQESFVEFHVHNLVRLITEDVENRGFQVILKGSMSVFKNHQGEEILSGTITVYVDIF